MVEAYKERSAFENSSSDDEVRQDMMMEEVKEGDINIEIATVKDGVAQFIQTIESCTERNKIPPNS